MCDFRGIDQMVMVVLYTDRDLQKMLNLSRKTLWRLRRRRLNPLPYLVLGGQIRYEEHAVERWLEQCKVTVSS